jgi:hypothetical protein
VKEFPVNQHPDVPVRITSARPSRSEDIHRRQTRYLTSMAIRTVCFVLAIVTTGWLRWTFVTAALFLPYVAVVLANATDRRSVVGPQTFAADDRPQLGSGVASPRSRDEQA